MMVSSNTPAALMGSPQPRSLAIQVLPALLLGGLLGVVSALQGSAGVLQSLSEGEGAVVLPLLGWDWLSVASNC
jgi:hypothetical protein